ncbi:AAA family ATPase [Mycobacterium marseillense]|uniref:AAA family ATPase n=1 Tax=Mycobacterium marseillense TaxID=701042 RepID=UPI000B21B95C|nr:AAA family ATPase [Mycobacterium marseillense]MCA2263966.1 AAA family ATPase [Mycobacterium marseillense]
MSEIKLHRASEMTASQPVRWLLSPGYLAKGKPNLLVGAEGIGKSLWAIRAMATVTTGQPWGPFTIADDPADVVLIATEDGWSDTIRPRLEIAGADLSRLYLLSAEDDGTGPGMTTDIAVLNERGIKPSLVVLDAWIDTVAGALNVKDPQKCRTAVKPWKDYAASTGAAVLLVTHTNRLDTGSSRDTYGLSGALRQIARSALYAVEDSETSALVVGPDKSNLASKAFAQRFLRSSVQKFDATADTDGLVPLLEHIGSDDRTVSQIVTAQHNERQRPARMTNDEVDNWLRDAISGRPVPSKDLTELAALHDISEDQLDRSKKRIGARCRKEGARWITELPSDSG